MISSVNEIKREVPKEDYSGLVMHRASIIVDVGSTQVSSLTHCIIQSGGTYKSKEEDLQEGIQTPVILPTH